MAAMFLIMFTTPHLENADLVMAPMRQNGGADRGTYDPRGPDLQVRADSHGQDLIDHDFLAHFRSKLFYLDLLASGNFVLLTTGLYDRVHVKPFRNAAWRGLVFGRVSRFSTP